MFVLKYIVKKEDVRETIEYISNFSLYAYEEEIRQGFITVSGGHRIGLAGKVVVEEGGIKCVKDISFINVRISNEKKGCGRTIFPYLFEHNRFCHTLIISPPGCGKTTLLRDLIRLISNGEEGYRGMTVGVIDERSEIAACYKGIPQNDIGIRTDVLDCCPKAEGMLMLIRSMSPSVIAVDELGKEEDIEALAYIISCGCKILATIHGSSIEEIKTKPLLSRLLNEKLFKRFILLSEEGKPGFVEKIVNEEGDILYSKK